MSTEFVTEADLVKAFCSCVERYNARRDKHDWAIYAETGGFDLLLACRRTGVQVGVEAKLALNLKVISQALEGSDLSYVEHGPDYRAVLVPRGPSVQKGIGTICRRIGLTVLTVYGYKTSWRGTHSPEWQAYPSLPDEDGGLLWDLREWHPWLPAKRIELPEYIPDVEGGHSSPIALTNWKIRAIKLMILLDRNGRVSRGDMKALGISPTRWTDSYHGFLKADADAGGYVRCSRTPDFRAQHPRNYVEIEADFEKWAPLCYREGIAA
jgi:hypothetical protein